MVVKPEKFAAISSNEARAGVHRGSPGESAFLVITTHKKGRGGEGGKGARGGGDL